MKIVQVGTGFIPISPRVTGGAEKHIHYLSAALHDLGHELRVIDMPTGAVFPSRYARFEVRLPWRHDFNLVTHALRGLLFGWAAAQQLERLIHRDLGD